MTVLEGLASIDKPERYQEIADCIRGKSALRSWYRDIYLRFKTLSQDLPQEGLLVELGSGGGFAKEIISGLIATDLIAYPGIDQVVDAMKMPFADGSIRGLLLMNVFHHIPNVGQFLHEVQRCLVPGGKMLIVDQYRGWLSEIILRRGHHEPYRPDAAEWEFDSSGPLSGANGALAWIVFERDIARFKREFPLLKIVQYTPHSSLLYWLAGGLKKWSILPGPLYAVARYLDALIVQISPRFASFVDIEVTRV